MKDVGEATIGAYNGSKTQMHHHLCEDWESQSILNVVMD